MEHNTNQITLRGNLSAPPTFSHENHGKQFYRFFLEVPRLSGAADTLPVIADKSLLESAGADPGGMLTVTGQIRSHNVRTDGRRHLMIFVFASALTCEDGEALNDALVRLAARLPEQPEMRITYFQPDARKTGGVYRTVSVRVRRLDADAQILVLTDGTRIPFDALVRLD